jgi:uncharacterized membrane protein
MQPIITNDAVVLGILMMILGLVFYTEHLSSKFWKRFYTIVPSLLLCYFLPALLHYPLGLIASEYFLEAPLKALLESKNLVFDTALNSMSVDEIKSWLGEKGIESSDYKSCIGKSNLYAVSSRYLLPACLVLLCISVDFKGLIGLGPKALIMFFAGTIGVVLGGPVALILTSYIAPGLINVPADELWRGLSTIAGSWIGGGPNQTAMKEIYGASDNLFAAMLVVDVIVANIWMGVLLYGAGRADKIDKFLRADNSAIETLKNKVTAFRESVKKMPNSYTMITMGALIFGVVGISHLLTDLIIPALKPHEPYLIKMGLSTFNNDFFWLICIATIIGILLSFTKAKEFEGVGASSWGSVFIYILVATIGMKMNLGEVWKNMGLFAIGFVWMIVHALIMFITAYIIRAPFFFFAVGSQANIGGAASAPIVATAFNSSLAPVGVLLAVLGYAVGTYGAIISAYLMQLVVN